MSGSNQVAPPVASVIVPDAIESTADAVKQVAKSGVVPGGVLQPAPVDEKPSNGVFVVAGLLLVGFVAVCNREQPRPLVAPQPPPVQPAKPKPTAEEYAKKNAEEQAQRDLAVTALQAAVLNPGNRWSPLVDGVAKSSLGNTIIVQVNSKWFLLARNVRKAVAEDMLSVEHTSFPRGRVDVWDSHQRRVAHTDWSGEMAIDSDD